MKKRVQYKDSVEQINYFKSQSKNDSFQSSESNFSPLIKQHKAALVNSRDVDYMDIINSGKPIPRVKSLGYQKLNGTISNVFKNNHINSFQIDINNTKRHDRSRKYKNSINLPQIDNKLQKKDRHKNYGIDFDSSICLSASFQIEARSNYFTSDRKGMDKEYIKKIFRKNESQPNIHESIMDHSSYFLPRTFSTNKIRSMIGNNSSILNYTNHILQENAELSSKKKDLFDQSNIKSGLCTTHEELYQEEHKILSESHNLNTDVIFECKSTKRICKQIHDESQKNPDDEYTYIDKKVSLVPTGVVTRISMESFQALTKKVFIKNKRFPAKIRIFEKQADIQILVSFENKYPNQKNYDFISPTNELIIKYIPFGKKFDELYITIYSKNKWNGQIGVAFTCDSLKPKNMSLEVPFTMDSCYAEKNVMQQELKHESKFWKNIKNNKNFQSVDPLELCFDKRKMIDMNEEADYEANRKKAFEKKNAGLFIEDAADFLQTMFMIPQEKKTDYSQSNELDKDYKGSLFKLEEVNNEGNGIKKTICTSEILIPSQTLIPSQKNIFIQPLIYSGNTSQQNIGSKQAIPYSKQISLGKSGIQGKLGSAIINKNKASLQNYAEEKMDKIQRMSIIADQKSVIALANKKQNHRKRIAEKIENADKHNKMRQLREYATQVIVKKLLNKTMQKTWIELIKSLYILILIDDLYEVTFQDKLTRMYRKYVFVRWQRYVKRKIDCMSPGYFITDYICQKDENGEKTFKEKKLSILSVDIVKNSIALYCKMNYEKISSSANGILLKLFKSMCNVLKIKQCFEKHISEKVALLNRMKSHQRNVQKNFEAFETQWQKAFSSLIIHEADCKTYDIECTTDIQNCMGSIGKLERKQIFNVIYNVSLLKFLKKRVQKMADEKYSNGIAQKFNRKSIIADTRRKSKLTDRSRDSCTITESSVDRLAEPVSQIHISHFTEGTWVQRFDLLRISRFKYCLEHLKSTSSFGIVLGAINKLKDRQFEEALKGTITIPPSNELLKNFERKKTQTTPFGNGTLAIPQNNNKRRRSRKFTIEPPIKIIIEACTEENQEKEERKIEKLQGIKQLLANHESKKFNLKIPDGLIKMIIITCSESIKKYGQNFLEMSPASHQENCSINKDSSKIILKELNDLEKDGLEKYYRQSNRNLLIQGVNKSKTDHKGSPSKSQSTIGLQKSQQTIK